MRQLAAALFLVSMARAQLPDVVTGGDHFNISGTVTDAVTAKPLARVQVSLEGSTPAAESRTASTDVSGNFAFNAVPTGVYALSGARAGYADSQKTILVSGTQATHFDLALQPQAILTGTVTDAANNPVLKARVFVLRPAIAMGRRQFLEHEEAQTDAHGAFRIAGLSPGACYVAVAANPPSDTASGAAAYPVTYYPNTTDPSTSQVLELRPGAENQADMKIAPVPAFQVAGRVSPALANITLRLLPPVGSAVKLEPAFSRTIDSQSGVFTLSGIPAGDYIVEATTKDRRGRDISAYRQITVAASNVSGVGINFSDRPALTGSLHVDGDTGGGQVLRAIILQAGADVFRQPARGDSFSVTQNIPPGSYTVSAELASNWYLASATQNGRDVIRGRVTIAEDGATPPLLLTASPRGATIEATVTWPDTGYRTPAHILVLQASNGEMRIQSDSKVPAPNVPATVRPALIGFLPPGQYVVYAWPEPLTVAYADPEALQAFEGFVQQLSIDEGQLVRVALKLAIPQ